jgi:hypothetical protein
MLTTQKVHALLRKAGLKKTYTYSTRIRGWRERVSGYHVGEDDQDIYVEYWTARGERDLAREDLYIERYINALAGFNPSLTNATSGRKRLLLPKQQSK